MLVFGEGEENAEISKKNQWRIKVLHQAGIYRSSCRLHRLASGGKVRYRCAFMLKNNKLNSSIHFGENMKLKIVSMFLSIVVTLFALTAHGEAVKASSGVVFLPFDAKNAGVYAVLKDGIRVMLSSRLALKDGIVPQENILNIEEQKDFLTSPTSADKSTFKKLNTDFIATGTMQTKDGWLLLRVDFYPESGSGPIEVTMLAENEQQIIESIEVLSQRIAEKVFGHKPAVPVPQVVASNQEGVEAFRTEHPDRKYKKEVVSSSTVAGSESNVAISQGDLVRRRSELPGGLVSMAVGDGDGDGKNEIFIASEKDLRVYYYERGVLKQQAEWLFKPALKVQGINVADIDGDNKVEIYLSAQIEERDIFSSIIFKWSPETGITQEIKDIRWSIRPLSIKGEGLILAGQAKAQRGDSVLANNIYKLDMDTVSKKYSRGKKLFLPSGLNLFDFVIADIDGDGNEEKVAITKNMKMAVYDQENSLVWLSEADFGGSVNYLGNRWRGKDGSVTGPTFKGDDENLQDLEYVPIRLIAMDVNNDGKSDIISAKNTLSTYRFLSNLRSFNGGNVVCMGWNGSEMVELWGTDTLGGYLADFYFVQNNDSVSSVVGAGDAGEVNKVKLYVGQIPSDSFANFLTVFSAKSNLIVYDFNIIEKNNNSSLDKQ